ncbi:MAG TPA: methyltransferase domain-containing protein [Nocardioides sp.]|uniref:methyltransferase domain-containing protein n=1 Tax=Nocardioides sp. TaxID=35761 RepID=UPI002D7EEBC6|nr:methyltransferase domain-containing protein [Nocardioides sp.]HET6653198.1 methyltransferase domain-containing protein [Nocardioides sp.]
MRQEDRARFDLALGRARHSAYQDGEFIEQESFMRVGEILALAERAGIGPGVSVLDVCCGVAGPGRLVTRATGCSYLGVDASAEAVGIARERAAGLDCRFEVGRVPPLPPGRFDVVLLLETLLAFSDKDALLRHVAAAMEDGGRFAFTVEEGAPLTDSERAAMPDADTVWPTPLPTLVDSLERAGLRVSWQAELSASHLAMVESLTEAFAADEAYIVEHVGRRGYAELVAAHRLWGDWLGRGRVRKFALVAEKLPAAASGAENRGARTAPTGDVAHLAGQT